MKYATRILFTAVLLAAAAPAMAMDSAPATEEQVYDFDGDNIHGDRLGPMMTNIDGHRQLGRVNLIPIRRDFVDRLLISIEHL